MLNIPQIQGFDWDYGNVDKNKAKHGVSAGECEELFFNRPLLIEPDHNHSHAEKRHYALGKTNANRLLFASFTIRNDSIRIISARDMSRRERTQYEKA